MGAPVFTGRVIHFFRGDLTFRRLLSNAGWLLGSNTISKSLSLVQGIIVARTLGVEQYGVLVLITTYTSTVNQFVDSRSWEAAIKFVTQYREERNPIRAMAIAKLCYLIDAITGTLAFGILFLTASLAARWFVKDASTAGLIQFYALSVLIAIPVGTSSALLRVNNKFAWLAYQNVGLATLQLAGVCVVDMLGSGVRGLLIIYLGTAVIGMLALLAMSRIAIRSLELAPWRKAPCSSLRGEYRRILRFLLATNGNAVLKLLRLNADVLLIGYWLSPVEAGYFRLARTITGLMNFPIGPFYIASYPEFAQLWHQRRVSTLRQLVHRLTLSSTLVALVALLVVWASSKWLIEATVGEQYLPALPVLYWLALATAIAVATNFGHPLLLAIGRAESTFVAAAVGITVQLILLTLLLPSIGIIAAGIAYLSFYLVWIVIVAVMLWSVVASQST